MKNNKPVIFLVYRSVFWFIVRFFWFSFFSKKLNQADRFSVSRQNQSDFSDFHENRLVFINIVIHIVSSLKLQEVREHITTSATWQIKNSLKHILTSNDAHMLAHNHNVNYSSLSRLPINIFMFASARDIHPHSICKWVLTASAGEDSSMQAYLFFHGAHAHALSVAYCAW
jgi:hypothetical protein